MFPSIIGRSMGSVGLAVAVVLLSMSTVAHGASPSRGLALDAKGLSPAVAATLRGQVSRAHTADPGAFRDVQSLVLRAPQMNRSARGGRAPIAIALAKMGPRALLPMIELLAFATPEALAAEDRGAARRDLIEAVGLLRDPRAMPVLGALLEREDTPAMTRTVAEAVARQDSPEAASRLVAAFQSAKGERKAAIALGMGMCHRHAVATSLAEGLDARPDEALATALIKSLGHVGNAWAWGTLADRTEETQTRDRAASALVKAFVAYRDEPREAAAKALLMVDAPMTAELLRRARGSADEEARAALDRLTQRFANNPAR